MRAVLLLALMGAIYSVLVVAHWNRGYLDFGDGNYMYISWRMSEGAVLYRDILAPQPPMHLVIGAAVAKLGALLRLPHPLYAFRGFSLLLHLATMVMVYKTGVRLSEGSRWNSAAGFEASSVQESDGRERMVGIAAAAIYLLLPIGFWWTLGYQSQPLLIFFLLCTFYLQLNACLPCAAASGVMGALAALTNMTTVAYLVFLAGYSLVRRQRLFLPFVVPMAVLVGLVITAGEMYTGAYLDNVIRNQVGAFPRRELLPAGQSAWTYAAGKLLREGTEVLRLEAGYLVLAGIGMALFSRNAASKVRELGLLFSLASLGAIVYVAKGGTMNYVFSVAEPYVALMAGYAVVTIAIVALPKLGRVSWRDVSPIAGAAAMLLVVFCTTWVGLQHSWRTLKQDTYELQEHETLRIVDQIKRNTPEDGVILAPPYYAFLAQRRIAADYSELFLWKLKYLNEQVDKQHGRAHEIVEQLAKMISEKKIAFMALDLDQTYTLPQIKAAVDANYEPQLEKPFRTLNTPIMFYKPKP